MQHVLWILPSIAKMSLHTLLLLQKVCQLYIPIVHFTKLRSLDTAQVKEMGLQEPQDDEQVKETLEEEEIQEISSLDFLNSKLKSSNISKVQQRDVHSHLRIVADILNMKYEDEYSKSHNYSFTFTIYK